MSRARWRSRTGRAAALTAAVLCACLAAAPAVLGAQPPSPPTAVPRGSSLRFVNARLEDVIHALGELLGLTVVTAEVPDKRVTVGTAGAPTAADVATLLEGLVESNGLVLVRRGTVAQVMPAAQVPATGAVDVGTELSDPPPLGLVTRLVPLQRLRAEEAREALRPIAAATARIEAVPRSNALLVTDRGSNVARYLELLRRLDELAQGEDGLRTYVVRLRYARADDLAGTLGQLYGATVPGPRRGSLDDRALSRNLDVFRAREQETFRQREERLPAALAPAAAPGAGRDSVRGPGTLVGQTTVVASPSTNALVVRTAPANIGLLRETIDSLDTRPAHVVLEVTVAEIGLGRGTEFGVDWAAMGREGQVRLGTPTAPDSTTPVTGVVAAVTSVTGLRGLDVRAVLRAIASTSRVRVLSTPDVLAENNREARILVGSKVPFISSQRLANDVALDRAVQYQDVGTALTIVPTINEDGYVSVQLLQEVSSLTNQTVQAAFNAPVILTREASTRAVVRDGQTVVIGGLIGTSDETIESGVPLLKDIPLFGALFRNQSVTRNRTELAIFVTPYVIRTDAEADAVWERVRRRTRDPEPGDARGTRKPGRPGGRP